jgi:hypothetical protein
MINRTKTIKTRAGAAVVISALSLLAYSPAYSQGYGKKGGGSAPPVENHPKIDEKAYKAALDRIPVPDKKYDPWGVARPSEPDKSTKK